MNPEQARGPIEGSCSDNLEKELVELQKQYGQAPNVEHPPPPPPPPVTATTQPLERLYECFQKQHPPVCEGSTNLVDVEDLKSSLQDIFVFMHLNDQEKVSCAAHMLNKDARVWCNAIKQTRDPTQMTWADFEVDFNEKYYNSAILTAKMNEFSRFYQVNLSLAEYARKFDRLAKFSPEMVPTETIRVVRFMEGLKPELARDVDMGHTGPMTYS
ncbi:uncharacterized protein LOC133824352 [Humulus lupulus]|uniref:uncharacterized protein LOC133824352 n=1 Tax=Humulus lupulus TaxID=3486 RepID=UPI002B41785E|nr:uncharacterized protein LOC133824352 [Humulus lupulus]